MLETRRPISQSPDGKFGDFRISFQTLSDRVKPVLDSMEASPKANALYEEYDDIISAYTRLYSLFEENPNEDISKDLARIDERAAEFMTRVDPKTFRTIN